MNTLVIVLISIAVYCLSAFLTWTYMHKAFGEFGIWKNLSPKRVDVILVFFPLINTMLSFVGWTFHYPTISKEYTRIERFFNLKN